jgi:hypothetical protein
MHIASHSSQVPYQSPAQVSEFVDPTSSHAQQQDRNKQSCMMYVAFSIGAQYLHQQQLIDCGFAS